MGEVFHFRLVLLGSHGVGFLFKKFEPKYRPTVEDLFSKDFDLGSIAIKVDFLDTSGSMQFPAMRRLSITTGSAFLIVYALDDEISYQILRQCVQEIREIRADFQEIPIVFAGNKCDLPRERRKVSKETVSNYVHYELPRLRAKVIECSCRDGVNIENIFRAYLSLAKVSLAGPGAALEQRNRPNSAQSAAQQRARCPADRCSSADCAGRHSMKAALGVRKSCDASIIVAGRVNQPAGQQTAANNNEQASNNNSNNNNDTDNNNNNNIASHQRRTETDGPSISECQPAQVNLETAIQSKLGQKEKPRSRSLIWRPSRKTRTTDAQPDCRLS